MKIVYIPFVLLALSLVGYAQEYPQFAPCDKLKEKEKPLVFFDALSKARANEKAVVGIVKGSYIAERKFWDKSGPFRFSGSNIRDFHNKNTYVTLCWHAKGRAEFVLFKNKLFKHNNKSMSGTNLPNEGSCLLNGRTYGLGFFIPTDEMLTVEIRSKLSCSTLGRPIYKEAPDFIIGAKIPKEQIQEPKPVFKDIAPVYECLGVIWYIKDEKIVGEDWRDLMQDVTRFLFWQEPKETSYSTDFFKEGYPKYLEWLEEGKELFEKEE